jgi:uncharacterized protein YbjT (DUF2867 family)
MTTTILVTGATGTIGSHVVAALAKEPDVKVRAAVRTGEKAKALTGANVTPVDFDYDQPATVAAALAGADKVFLLTPFSDKQAELGKGLVDAAAKAGVKHVVKLSAIGSDIEPGIQLGRWHRAVEKHLEASGLAWTILRPNNFFENFVNYYPPAKDGNIYLPWGTAACSFMAGADIAAVATKALTTPGHEGKAYALTGPEAITIAQAAGAIAEVSGRKIAYVDVPEAAAKKAMLDMGMPGWMVDAMMELHAIDKAGYAAAVTDEVPRLLGRPATTFLDFAKQRAAAWKV